LVFGLTRGKHKSDAIGWRYHELTNGFNQFLNVRTAAFQPLPTVSQFGDDLLIRATVEFRQQMASK
jgi:hypothetical protein